MYQQINTFTRLTQQLHTFIMKVYYIILNLSQRYTAQKTKKKKKTNVDPENENNPNSNIENYGMTVHDGFEMAAEESVESDNELIQVGEDNKLSLDLNNL